MAILLLILKFLKSSITKEIREFEKEYWVMKYMVIGMIIAFSIIGINTYFEGSVLFNQLSNEIDFENPVYLNSKTLDVVGAKGISSWLWSHLLLCTVVGFIQW